MGSEGKGEPGLSTHVCTWAGGRGRPPVPTLGSLTGALYAGPTKARGTRATLLQGMSWHERFAMRSGGFRSTRAHEP